MTFARCTPGHLLDGIRSDMRDYFPSDKIQEVADDEVTSLESRLRYIEQAILQNRRDINASAEHMGKIIELIETIMKILDIPVDGIGELQ